MVWLRGIHFQLVAQPRDVLVDAMRGRFTTWTRIRLNLILSLIHI